VKLIETGDTGYKKSIENEVGKKVCCLHNKYASNTSCEIRKIENNLFKLKIWL